MLPPIFFKCSLRHTKQQAVTSLPRLAFIIRPPIAAVRRGHAAEAGEIDPRFGHQGRQSAMRPDSSKKLFWGSGQQAEIPNGMEDDPDLRGRCYADSSICVRNGELLVRMAASARLFPSLISSLMPALFMSILGATVMYLYPGETADPGYHVGPGIMGYAPVVACYGP